MKSIYVHDILFDQDAPTINLNDIEIDIFLLKFWFKTNTFFFLRKKS